MLCFACNSATKIMDAGVGPDGYERKRQCLSEECKKEFVTVETVVTTNVGTARNKLDAKKASPATREAISAVIAKANIPDLVKKMIEEGSKFPRISPRERVLQSSKAYRTVLAKKNSELLGIPVEVLVEAYDAYRPL